jgi:organic hydroperoxide reductase OsmC/OhrA
VDESMVELILKQSIMKGQHKYKVTIKWTGNNGTGTSNYREFERSHIVSVDNKPVILGSSDTVFRGDSAKYNPEDLLVASLSSCHMLWYLHLCSEAGVIVTDYTDNATGIMVESANGGGHFIEVNLNPIVTVVENLMIQKANELHKKANEFCFIANSVNFNVQHNPTCLISENNREK